MDAGRRVVRLAEVAWPRVMTVGMMRGGWNGEVSSRCSMCGYGWVAGRGSLGLCIWVDGREHWSGEEVWGGKTMNLCWHVLT